MVHAKIEKALRKCCSICRSIRRASTISPTKHGLSDHRVAAAKASPAPLLKKAADDSQCPPDIALQLRVVDWLGRGVRALAVMITPAVYVQFV